VDIVVIDIDMPLLDTSKDKEMSNNNKEGANQLLINCKQLKMTAEDGRKRLADVANTEQLLRLIRSIPF
jgi:hypothetical protein